jgi:hypothetical protein
MVGKVWALMICFSEACDELMGLQTSNMGFKFSIGKEISEFVRRVHLIGIENCGPILYTVHGFFFFFLGAPWA